MRALVALVLLIAAELPARAQPVTVFVQGSTAAPASPTPRQSIIPLQGPMSMPIGTGARQAAMPAPTSVSITPSTGAVN